MLVSDISFCTFSNGRNKTNILKLASAIFYQIFIFHQIKPIKNYEKYFLFHLKSFFRSRVIQIFVFPSSPLFLSVSHCFKGCSKINLKVYDIINCLNKNLIMYFVWYLEKDKRHDIETLSIDRVPNKEHFYGKIIQKMCTKSYPRTPFLILVNNLKQPLHSRNYFKKKIFLKEDYQKALKS